jgi:Arc/MetJ family transcription regulator
MRITVDIDEAILTDLLEITGDKNKSPAVAKAVTEFVRRKKAKEFGRLIREGAFDYYGPEDTASSDFTDPIPPLYPDEK